MKWYPLSLLVSFLYFPENLRRRWVEIQVMCYCNGLHGVFGFFTEWNFIVIECTIWNPIPNVQFLQTFPQKKEGERGLTDPEGNKRGPYPMSFPPSGQGAFLFLFVDALLF